MNHRGGAGDAELAALRRTLGSSRSDDSCGVGAPEDAVVDQGVAEPRTSKPLGDEARRLAGMILGDTGDARAWLRAGIETIVVSASSVVLGRANVCQPAEQDGRISRRHARVAQVDGVLTVVDLGSANGTFRVREGQTVIVGPDPVELAVGDKITTVDNVLIATVVEGDQLQ